MGSESPQRLPPTPSMPLFPVSPERLNSNAYVSHASKPGLISSPSMPAFDMSSPHSSPTQLRSKNSDVQGMVARFNALEIKDHQEMRRRDEAALKRAQVGREQAEEEVSRVKEELRSLRREYEEGRERERRVARRVESVMEQLHSEKEKTASMQKTYEREIRRARKEAFKSSSHLLETQKELKVTKAALNAAKVNLETWVIPDGEELKARAEGVEMELGKALRLVEHMKMECQFGVCACRLAELKGEIYVADADEQVMELMSRLKPTIVDAVMDEEPPAYEEPQRPAAMTEDMPMSAPMPTDEKERMRSATPHGRRSSTVRPPGDMMIYSPDSGTFRRVEGPENTMETSGDDRHDEKNAGTQDEAGTKGVLSAEGFGHDEEPKTPTTPATSVHAFSPKHDIPPASEDEHSEGEEEENLTHSTLPVSEKMGITEDEDVGENDDEEEDEIDTVEDLEGVIDNDEELLESPTAHIRATTQITTVPLAPLSSPSRPGKASHERESDDGEEKHSPSQPDVAQKQDHQIIGAARSTRATTPRPDSDEAPEQKQNPTTPKIDTSISSTATPAPKSAGDEDILSSTPWANYSSTPLTRDDAIAMLRARRGRAKTNPSDDADTGGNAENTPKRSASHGSGLTKRGISPRKGAITPGRRDISTVSAPDLTSRTPGGRKR